MDSKITFGRAGLTLEQMFGPQNVPGSITELKLTPGELNRLDGNGLEYHTMPGVWYDEVPTYANIATATVDNGAAAETRDEPVPFTRADKDVLKALTDEYIAVHKLGNEAKRAATDATVSIQGLAAAGKQHGVELSTAVKTIELLRGVIDKQSEALKAQEQRLAELSEFVGRTLEENSAALLRALDRVDLIDSELALAQREKATPRKGRKVAA